MFMSSYQIYYFHSTALTPGGSNLAFTSAFHPLLRAGPATTPVLTPGVSIGAVRSSSTTSSNGTPKFGSLTTTPLSLSSASSIGLGGEEGKPSPVTLIPNTVQTLVSQIQQAQVHHHHHHSGGAPTVGGGVSVTTPLSQAAQVISTTPTSHLQSSPHLALPLAIALPGGSASGESTFCIAKNMSTIIICSRSKINIRFE